MRDRISVDDTWGGIVTNRSAALAAFFSLLVSFCPAGAWAQGGKALVGTWALVTNVTIDANGKKDFTFGDKPLGRVTFSPNGSYTLIITRADLPKFASHLRVTGSTEENKAIVLGMIAHFGKYTVDEKEKAIVLRIESASYPNWNGTEQKRTFSVTGNELKWTTPNASGGGTAELVWKRL